MESSKIFKDERVFQKEIGDPISSNSNMNYEKYKLTLRPDGSATLFREYHYYYTRNNENYDDQVDSIETLEGTYELSVDDSEVMIICLNFRLRSLHSTGFMGYLEHDTKNEAANISFEYIERKWRNAVGFTYRNNIFANFDDQPDNIYYQRELEYLHKLGFQEKEGIAELRKYNKDIKKILKEKFPDPKIEEGLNLLKKKMFPLSDWTEDWEIDMTVGLIQSGGDPVMALESKSENFRLFQNMLRSEGIADLDGAIEAYMTCPVGGDCSEWIFKWYKRRELFKEQITELRNYYDLQENEIEEAYRTLLCSEGKLQSVLTNLEPTKRYKKELELLKQDGFIDEEINLILLSEWLYKTEWKYEDYLALFKIRTDERANADFGYMASEFNLWDINHKAYQTYLKNNKNVNLTALDLLNPEENESASIVQFNLRCKCPFGQSVYLTGSCDELASWNVYGAKKMKWNEGDSWNIVLCVKSPTITYKYFLSASDVFSSDYMNAVTWENRENREFKKQIEREYQLNDTWE